LAAPEFLDNFLGKLAALRGRLDGVLGLATTFLGVDGDKITAGLDAAVVKLDKYRTQMQVRY
jgi:hypothetical protein